ncbi:MAG: ABC transporter permease [Butyrivibrio sp.]|nr:ABC transporter permease [Acetatifactor muris]MCM1558489.1 ABC transporter permease [Butyrivibrio sp.]
MVFLRDRAAVFFSVLSMLIVLGLMVVFLGKMNSDDLVELLAQFGGERDRALDERNAAYLIQLWTLGGILVVNSVTVTLTVLGIMVRDETKKCVMAFYVTPVNRVKLSLGYILSAWLVGTGMCVLTLAAGEVYFSLRGYGLLSGAALLKLTGIIALCAFTFSALGYLLALFVHSDSAWSGLLTVIGTLVGFLGGIYLSLGFLSEGLQNVLKCIPILHGAAMLRDVCTEAAIAETFAGLPDRAGDVFRKEMGVTLFWGEREILFGEQVAFLLVCAIIAIGAAALVNRRRKLKDR